MSYEEEVRKLRYTASQLNKEFVEKIAELVKAKERLKAVEEADPIVHRNDQITLGKAMSLKPDRIVISPGPGSPESILTTSGMRIIKNFLGCD